MGLAWYSHETRGKMDENGAKWGNMMTNPWILTVNSHSGTAVFDGNLKKNQHVFGPRVSQNRRPSVSIKISWLSREIQNFYYLLTQFGGIWRPTSCNFCQTLSNAYAARILETWFEFVQNTPIPMVQQELLRLTPTGTGFPHCSLQIGSWSCGSPEDIPRDVLQHHTAHRVLTLYDHVLPMIYDVHRVLTIFSGKPPILCILLLNFPLVIGSSSSCI